MKLLRNSLAVITLSAVGAIYGCSQHTPEDYHHARPDMTDVDAEDRGLQSAEVIEASEMLANKILALPEVTQSTHRLTVVFDHLEDLTHTRQFNYDIFLERLKTQIGEKGRDRIAIITNRQSFNTVRDRELDSTPGAHDEFGQGDGHPGGAPAANPIQPDFALTGKVMDLPNRGTDYYHFTFSLSDLRNRSEIPMGYDVRVRR
jgi:hypothetical protein